MRLSTIILLTSAIWIIYTTICWGGFWLPNSKGEVITDIVGVFILITGLFLRKLENKR